MNHDEFTAAYARGEIKVEFDPHGASHYLSTRLLLPFVVMPVLGVGVALALIGWILTGLAIILLGIVVLRVIKRFAPHFLFQHALANKRAYEALTKANILRVTSFNPVNRGS